MTTRKNVALVLFFLAGCQQHIAPYHQKARKFDRGTYAKPITREISGSLFNDSSGLLEDERARQVGDLIVIRIDELDQATRDGSTKLARSSSTQAGIANNFGLLAGALPSGVSDSALLGATGSNSVQGEAKISRLGRLTATLPVRVREIMPNGDFYVEGTKVILVNEEEHHLYVSGIVRPQDIGPNNVVASSRVSDAEIEYTGVGLATDTQRQGWLARLYNKLWPF